MNQTERDLIETALALLLRAKTSMHYRALGGRSGNYDDLAAQMTTIVTAELGLEGLLWATEKGAVAR